ARSPPCRAPKEVILTADPWAQRRDLASSTGGIPRPPPKLPWYGLSGHGGVLVPLRRGLRPSLPASAGCSPARSGQVSRATRSSLRDATHDGAGRTARSAERSRAPLPV